MPKDQKVKLVIKARTVYKALPALKDLKVQMVNQEHPEPGVFLVTTELMVKSVLEVILVEMVNRVNLVYPV